MNFASARISASARMNAVIRMRDVSGWFSFRGFEARQFLDDDIAVGAIAPLERADPGAERRSHRIELLAIGRAGYVGRRVGEKLRVLRLQHLIERRLEVAPDDIWLRPPCIFARTA